MAKGTREKRPVPSRRKKAKALPQSGVPAGAGVYALVGAERRRVLSKISNYSKGHQSEAAAVGRALHVLGELIRAGHPKTAKSFKRCVEAAIAKTDTAKPYTCQRKASSIACPFCLLEIQLAVVEWMRTEPRLNADAAEWVTVAAPSWQRPLGQLKDFSIRNAKARVYAALKAPDLPPMTVFGRLEIVLHVTLNGVARWRPHFHFLVFADDLEGAVSGLRERFGAWGPRAVVTEPVKDLRRLTSYLNKGISGLKEENPGRDGRVRPWGKQLSEMQGAELEHFQFMHRRPLKELILNYRVRLPHSMLTT